jgi:hypothetical protein
MISISICLGAHRADGAANVRMPKLCVCLCASMLETNTCFVRVHLLLAGGRVSASWRASYTRVEEPTSGATWRGLQHVKYAQMVHYNVYKVLLGCTRTCFRK